MPWVTRRRAGPDSFLDGALEPLYDGAVHSVGGEKSENVEGGEVSVGGGRTSGLGRDPYDDWTEGPVRPRRA